MCQLACLIPHRPTNLRSEVLCPVCTPGRELGDVVCGWDRYGIAVPGIRHYPRVVAFACGDGRENVTNYVIFRILDLVGNVAEIGGAIPPAPAHTVALQRPFNTVVDSLPIKSQ